MLLCAKQDDLICPCDLVDGTDSEVEKLLRDAARGEAGVDAVREFLKKYPGRVDACAPGGGRKTCLQVAAHQGQRELCTLLLDAGASLRAVDEDGDTPLHYAAFGYVGNHCWTFDSVDCISLFIKQQSTGDNGPIVGAGRGYQCRQQRQM